MLIPAHSIWRLITSGPAAGAWNMAADELLLDQCCHGGGAALRLYSWDQPTLTLGYFQALDEIPPDHLDRWAVVRRPTGGGAILHDRELTYAVAVPEPASPSAAAATLSAAGPSAAGSQASAVGAALYDGVNAAILRAVREFGVTAEVRGAVAGERAQRGTFFCFARSGSTDIIAAGKKLAGGAQRRRPGGILQHGSIVLDATEPEAVGLKQLLGRAVGFDELAAALRRGFQEQLGVEFEQRGLTAAEEGRIEEIRRTKYATRDWLVNGDRQKRRKGVGEG